MKPFVKLASRAILFLIFCFFFVCGYTQTPTMREWGWQQLDTAYLVCQYKYTRYEFMFDTNTTHRMRLEIGKHISKFYSYDCFEYDSLRSTPQGKEIINRQFSETMKRSAAAPEEEKGKILAGLPGKKCEFIVYKNFPEAGQMMVQDTDGWGVYYKYTEEDFRDSQSWQIESDTTTILGYRCQKATCDWRGRKFIAWFTPDIPLFEGPYKFCGLPGLIMKVEDDEHLHSFEIQGIWKSEDDGIFLAEVRGPSQVDTYEETDRETVLSVQIKKYKNMVRRSNRDAQRLDNAEMALSEKKVATKFIECE